MIVSEQPIQRPKKTRQGRGRGTKWGTKPTGNASKKTLNRYKKKNRGQGNKR
jgi:hypothetical protein